MSKKILFLLVFCVSCSHEPQKQFQAHLENHRCEDAKGAIPELQRSGKAATSASWMATSTLAYSYVGLNYTAEVVWDASVGTLVFVMLCAPAAIASAGSNQCIPPTYVPIKKLVSPPLGRKAWEKTHDMRCPNVEPLALSLEKVATCFELRDTEKDKQLAITTLNNIENSKYFFSCVSSETRDRIVRKRIALEAVPVL